MQKKYTISRNTIKKTIKTSKSSGEDILNTSIAKKSFSDDVHINIITATNIDTTNLSRLKTPIQAEYASGMASKKRRRAVRNLTLKSAPPVPTAPKDPRARMLYWIKNQVKTHVSEIDIPMLILTALITLIGLFF